MDIFIPIEICNPDATLPTYANPNDGAMDVYTTSSITIEPHEVVSIPLGFKVAIPRGYAILVQPRSSVSAKTPLRIPNSPGLIDAGFRDEVCIVVENISDESFIISKGERIAQMRLVEVPHIMWNKVQDVSKYLGNRGGGFGSTGK